jgi:hypothetical protein
VQAQLVERTPSMSDLNEVVFGQVLLSFPLRQVYLLYIIEFELGFAQPNFLIL